LYRGAVAARAHAYAAGHFAQGAARLPTVAVGNLTVGGAGKTPIASWIAKRYVRHGLRPGILLRGYGSDEGDVHRRLVPESIVVENPERLEGAREAARRGAEVVVLDDAYQRLDVRRDLNICVVAAESMRGIRSTLPAGPWREPLRALDRADIVVVTRKRASRTTALALAGELRAVAPGGDIALAQLQLTDFRGLRSNAPTNPDALRGARLVTAAGVADPDSFAFQCQRLGAVVCQFPLRDHERFSRRRLQRLFQAGRAVDYVVVTEKDAVKLRLLWPQSEPEPLVAGLGVTWDLGQEMVERALDAAVLAGNRRSR
jgi:tetraacyldisaccharide 4'-kinase